MSDQHIARAFDRDLDAIQAQVMKMGGLVEAAVLDSARALETSDMALADQVRRADAAIDAMEERINEDAARVIALRAPTASDLRLVLSVMKIAGNLERMGDYAKNIAKRTRALESETRHAVPEDATGALRRMAKAVTELLSDALDAYSGRRLDLAQDVRARDRDIDQMYNALFRELLTHMLEDPATISACIHLHFIAKNIERIGDHATGIAEQVAYLITGQLPDEPRPKEDVVAGQAGVA